MGKAPRSDNQYSGEWPTGHLLAAPDRLVGLDAALDVMGEGLALFDESDRLVICNRRLRELFPFILTQRDLTFEEIARHELNNLPQNGALSADEREVLLAERLQRHALADGEPFDVPLNGGGWARVRERRTSEGWIVSTWMDISQHKLTERKLLDAIGGINEGFVLLDASDRILLHNQRMEQIFAQAGVPLETGLCLPDLMRKAADNGLFATPDAGVDDVIQLATSGTAPSQTRTEIALSNGQWILISHHRMPDGNTVGIWTNVTTQKTREIELGIMRHQLAQQSAALAEFARLVSRQARTDLLTGLPNRFALEERLDHALRNSQTRRIWVGFIDIDHFRGVNDALGHGQADKVLREIALFLRGLLRTEDMLSRVGGDEFAVVLTELDESDAIRIMRRINSAIREQRFGAGEQGFSLTLSIGLVHATPGDHTTSSLLAASDTACRVAKEGGRDRMQIYDLGDPRVNQNQQRSNWAERIRLALEQDRLELHLQAIVDGNGGVLGYETLIRLREEDGSYCGPNLFLPAARRLGMMRRIDVWVCRHAIAYAMRLLAQGKPHYVSANIGARALSDTAFQDDLIKLLDMNPGIEKALHLEITETEEMDDLEQTVSFLSVLRRRGIRVYLDDFGHGYNSFEVLKQLPVDGIKIDWTVTRDMLEDPINEALIKAAISIAQSLRLELVAEGVEREAQLQRLQALGVQIYQGFLFHRPQPAERTLEAMPG